MNDMHRGAGRRERRAAREELVVRALRSRRLLAGAQPTRTPVWWRSTVARALAACLVAAVALRAGFVLGARSQAGAPVAAAAPLQVQSSGHAFVTALSEFMLADSSLAPGVRQQGRDAAMAAILAAASALARTATADSTAEAVARLIQQARSAAFLARGSGS